MTGPFPGMDPYLEAQSDWPGFHNALITHCSDSLNQALPETYVARIDRRISLVSIDASQEFRPDVIVARWPDREAVSTSASSMLLEPVKIPLAKHAVDQVPEAWIEIRRLPELQLVTVIELLSPTNKVGAGRAEYLDKRDALIDQPVNLVEIDLLITGLRLPMQRALPPAHYYALIARAEQRPDCDVYGWTPRDRLPRIPIPLQVPDPDVGLDLAAAFRLVYDGGRFARTLDHTQPLPAAWPLRSEDRIWAEEQGRKRV